MSGSLDTPIWLQMYFQVPPQISVVITFRPLKELCTPHKSFLFFTAYSKAITANQPQKLLLFKASFFHASSIHCTKVITRPRDPRLKEHPFLFSENSLPSIRSHNKPNKNPLVNNGLCPALVQLNKVQVKVRKLRRL